MSGVEEAFQQTVTAGLGVLVLGLETRLDAGLQQLLRMPWAAIEAVRALGVQALRQGYSARGIKMCLCGGLQQLRMPWATSEAMHTPLGVCPAQACLLDPSWRLAWTAGCADRNAREAVSTCAAVPRGPPAAAFATCQVPAAQVGDQSDFATLAQLC